MNHKAKLDVWTVAAILFAFAVLLLGGNRWVVGPVLLVLLICAYPQSYVTTPGGLLVRAGLSRRLIPYETITFVGPGSDRHGNFGLLADRIVIHYGLASELMIAPADRGAFLADISARTPHLIKRGQRLVAAFV